MLTWTILNDLLLQRYVTMESSVALYGALLSSPSWRYQSALKVLDLLTIFLASAAVRNVCVYSTSGCILPSDVDLLHNKRVARQRGAQMHANHDSSTHVGRGHDALRNQYVVDKAFSWWGFYQINTQDDGQELLFNPWEGVQNKRAILKHRICPKHEVEFTSRNINGT